MTVKSEEMIAALDPGSISKIVCRALSCSWSGIFIVDTTKQNFPVVFANTRFCQRTGYIEDEIVGQEYGALLDGDNGHQARDVLREVFAHRGDVSRVVPITRKDGTQFFGQLVISPVIDDAGKVSQVIGIHNPIPALNAGSEERRQPATVDAATELPNRKALWEFLYESIQTSPERSSNAFALFVVDVDQFRFVNKSIGYERADKLLQLIAQRLRASVQVSGFVARHGVDEFAVVLPGISGVADAAPEAEKLSRAMSTPFIVDGETVRITCSVGISLHPKDGAEAPSLVRHANLALHRAKELGRNNSQFFAPEMNDHVVERMRIEIALRSAVEKNELSLHYQPLADLQTGRIVGMEALARWQSAELGAVVPAQFIAVAEECGLIEHVGEWALRRACMDMRSWIDSGLPPVRVAVNVSPRQFRDPALAAKIGKALAEFSIAPSMLCLEITENVFMQDTPASEATLARLRALGIDLILDDFGTGYSSLNYLKRYPFKKVKIDRSFIENIVTNGEDAAIAKAVISMAHSLGIRVVAEGVETEAQCDFLRRNICDEIQGFLLSPPMAPDELRDFLCSGRCLPAHLLRRERPPRTLLLVDDEVNVIASLKRLLRCESYTILTANSGQEGLEILAKNEVDVIVSDQRMPGMTGVEFLGRCKALYPDTIRIMLSGYTELRSVTDAVNEGAIYKFLTKPWEDSQLRAHIEEAFRRKEMADENQRLNLEVRTANFELAVANRRLEELSQQQQQQISSNTTSLDVVHEVLEHIPMPVIGLDEDEFIAFINSAARQLVDTGEEPLGGDAREIMPDIVRMIGSVKSSDAGNLQLKNSTYRVKCHCMGQGSESRGVLVTLAKE